MNSFRPVVTDFFFIAEMHLLFCEVSFCINALSILNDFHHLKPILDWSARYPSKILSALLFIWSKTFSGQMFRLIWEQILVRGSQISRIVYIFQQFVLLSEFQELILCPDRKLFSFTIQDQSHEFSQSRKCGVRQFLFHLLISQRSKQFSLLLTSQPLL